ncbi:MAG: LysM peptidoglycan-binding domain-containing protein [Bacteroidetes bacterium]|nr:LysM peptidoglycan-binding domain-containing protein [Bacteroidota bacterium]
MMKLLKALLIIVFIAFQVLTDTVSAQMNKDTVSSLFKPMVLLKDNPVIAALDSMATLKCFEKYNSTSSTNELNIYKYAPDYVPTFSDSIYTLRIAKLNAKSPFGLVYNDDVKTFINLYAFKKRNLTSRIMGLAEYYFPLFEEYLDKYHLPLELKYLAIVESALNPVAKSSAAAVGLWQFIYTTGKMYNLKVTSYVDDRSDPLKGTIAACEHFRDLYAIYKDWALVLAAYNSGPGNVNKAIRKANGEMDFWKIKKYLPKETQSYVPAFIAVNYVMNYSTEHNLYPVACKYLSYASDTVTVKQKLTFDQISEAMNIPKDEIAFLNPCFKDGVIPAFDNETFTLRLPTKQIGYFIVNEPSLYKYKTKAMLEEERLLSIKLKEIQRRDSLLALKKQIYKKQNLAIAKTKAQSLLIDSNIITSQNNETPKIYTVKSGEGLGVIASKNKCTIAQIQEWNSLKTLNIFPNQKLYVQDPSINKQKDTISNKTAKTDVKIENTTTSDKQTTFQNNSQNGKTKIVYHVVQKGDTLWDIANKYKGVTVEEIKKLNNLTNTRPLFVGQKLKVAIAS